MEVLSAVVMSILLGVCGFRERRETEGKQRERGGRERRGLEGEERGGREREEGTLSNVSITVVRLGRSTDMEIHTH